MRTFIPGSILSSLGGITRLVYLQMRGFSSFPQFWLRLVVSLDSYRLETQSRLGVNQTLSLGQVTSYEPNHDELCYKRKCTVITL
jgi:hypothetical protein